MSMPISRHVIGIFPENINLNFLLFFLCAVLYSNICQKHFMILASLPGSVQIKNWKPLPFDAISGSPNDTVEDVIGHLLNVATLRIKLFRYVQLFHTPRKRL